MKFTAEELVRYRTAHGAHVEGCPLSTDSSAAEQLCRCDEIQANPR